MKKIICYILLVIFLITGCQIAIAAPSVGASAQTTELKGLKSLDLVTDSLPQAPTISSKYAIIIDNTTKTILYNKGNLTDKIYPASITKILTAIVVMENVDDPDNTTVKVSRNAANTNGSKMGLRPNDELTITALLYGLMLPSGNDAAKALAEHVGGGSIETFVDMMNDKAQELGAKNSNFKNPNGLHNDDHYTCLYDIALFAHEYTKYPLLSKISNAGTYTASMKNSGNRSTLELENTNKFVLPGNQYYNKYFTGLKTGTTSAAGRCLATRYQRGSKDIITITFKCVLEKEEEEEAKCYSDMLSLVEYADSNFTKINLKDVFSSRDFTMKVENATVADENNGMLALRIENIPDITYVTTTALAQALRNTTDPISLVLPQELSAPIYTGDNVGKITIYFNDQILIESDLIATRTVLDHLEVPDDLLLLFLNTEEQNNTTDNFFAIILIGLLAVVAVFVVFFLIKLYIYIMTQRKHQKSNVYSRSNRKRTPMYYQ